MDRLLVSVQTFALLRSLVLELFLFQVFLHAMWPVTQVKRVSAIDFSENNRNAEVQKSVQKTGDFCVLH